MSDELLLACSLSKWQGGPKCCRWCDKPLTGRQQRWCSGACAGHASANHWFTSARHRALKRDGRQCVRCGAPEATLGGGLWRSNRLEVHHRDEKADGRHGQCSCAHHVDGLETLCRPCHLAEHRSRPEPQPEQLAIEEQAA
jgi:hypothetical protein